MPMSLDPPVQSSENRQSARHSRQWIGWLLLVLVLCFSGWGLIALTGGKSKSAHSGDVGKTLPIPVTMAPVTTQNFPIYLDGLGTVQAYNSVQVNARVPGLIQEIKFQEGQEVKQGDLLATIDPRTYQAQYNQALAKKVQDEAQLQSARVLLDRDQELLTKAVLDKQTYDTQKYLVAQLEGAVQSDAANLEIQKAQLDWTQVTAPISGKTGVRQMDAGNQVSVGGNNPNTSNNAIVTINQIQPIYVSFTMPQQELGQIREPMLAHKKLDVIALDRNNQTVLAKGVLSVIDNEIDPATATVKIKAQFSNEDYKLWPGQFVNVRLLVGDRPDALVVPSEAVQLGPDGPYVYVLGEGNKAVMRTVSTGPTEGAITLITSGVKAGEMIVTDGQYRLQPGSVVTNAPPKLGNNEPKKSR